MKLGVNIGSLSSNGYARYFGGDTYKKAAEFGFSCVDLDLSWVVGCADDAAAERCMKEKALAEAAGMTIHQAHAPVKGQAAPLTEAELGALIEDNKRAIRLCGMLGCRYLVVHPFMVNGWGERRAAIAADTFEKNVVITRQLAEYAKEFGVYICYENMPCVDFSISHPSETLAVVKAAAHENLKLCLDIGHCAAFTDGRSIYDDICSFGDLLRVLHVHDTYGRADQHNFPGMGCTDWRGVMRGLEAIGFAGVFSLELNHPVGFTKELFSVACRLSCDMAKEIIAGKWGMEV